jgi:hypothetical protein
LSTANPAAAERAVRRLIEITSRQQHAQRKLVDRLWGKYAIAKPGNKLLAVAELDSDAWALSKS